MKNKLLIIEDEASLAKQLKWGLSDTYEVMIANTVEKARQLISSDVFQVVTLDLGLPPYPDTPEEGLRLLETMSALTPYTKVIVITGNAEQENAMKAIALGAVDFCAKPIELELLKIILKRTFRIYELEAANRQLRQECRNNYSLCDMLGISPLMEDLFKLIPQVSVTHYPVLIRGESGTGKEVAARAVHSLSGRSQEPMIVINCGAIPENLLESELFGHEKGAFTGASGQKIGKFEHADGGTVFLDEIGDMPLGLQVKLLRFLQEGTIERVGGTRTITLDVRVIAATHVDLEKAVKEGSFREDLYYRLNVVPITIPSLRERQEDILLLANHFIRTESQKLHQGKVSLSSAAVSALTSHSWPGNVRELQNCIYRAMTTSAGGIISPSDLGLSEEPTNSQEPVLTIKEARDAAEQHAILRVLTITGDNITQASKLLGVSRPTLHDLLKKHGINR
ncbi:PEP-CTERM-box response regulator transcription factor [Desulfonema magnum]|uniref:PEP-CTERM-box response regulator transcription factor n=1 Tax=Desulfonema magnum TaxID=45655 RepID=A0A975GRJ3_9BACT|nr:PEP-CTERM-box response regulator transcription factor [Desulfonema magnum]QTA90987.1 PEP-CTERM-box response regulator transcription factor [Desulfonema magnum]